MKMFQEIIMILTKNKQPRADNILVILTGLPYSGKSTLAQKLSERNFIHIWGTKIKKYYKLDDENFLSLSEEIIDTLLKSGYNVIFDFLNHKKIQRERIATIAKNNSKRCLIAYLNPPQNIIVKRQSNVNESSGRTNISRKVIEEISSEFETPQGKNVFEIRNDTDFEEFLTTYKNPELLPSYEK